VTLPDSVVPIQGFNQHEYQAASPENCLITPNQQIYSNDTLEKFRRLAQDISWLMNSKLSAKEPDWFGRRYRQKPESFTMDWLAIWGVTQAVGFAFKKVFERLVSVA
jgi:hypothetical protein